MRLVFCLSFQLVATLPFGRITLFRRKGTLTAKSRRLLVLAQGWGVGVKKCTRGVESALSHWDLAPSRVWVDSAGDFHLPTPVLILVVRCPRRHPQSLLSPAGQRGSITEGGGNEVAVVTLSSALGNLDVGGLWWGAEVWPPLVALCRVGTSCARVGVSGERDGAAPAQASVDTTHSSA